MVEWASTHGIICDLDLNLLFYDERGRFVERLSAESPKSRDESCVLVNDIDVGNQYGNFLECVTVDLMAVDHTIQAIMMYLDGGPRNFQYLQSIAINCISTRRVNAEETFLSSSSADKKHSPIFQINGKCRKDYQGVMLVVLYKDGWDKNGHPQWVCNAMMEPMYVTAVKEKEEKCEQMIINTVPALEKFKPKLFVSVRAICAALSSHALPRLKKKFTNNGALSIGQFTEVIFKQLAVTHPRVVDESEAGFTVAMLQEMFYQIDFNGDTTVDWDEFTTFCIQTGLQVSSSENPSNSDSLDEYVIEYGEELMLRDRVLSPHRYITLMRHVPETRRLLVIPEGSDNIFIFDEQFKLRSHLYPSKIVVIGEAKTKGLSNDSASSSEANSVAAQSGAAAHGRIAIYDVIYLTTRELYAYCASDHTITICKEQMIGARVNYIQHNRFFHSLLHLKLCWSAKSKVLCSVASDKVIYGWDIDAEKPIFQISRHSDLITDMISIDHLELFATCSMDKRIVLWSSATRRVKGVLLGHKRGVRCLDVFENTLLSAGFETEAKTWDLVSKDCTAILKGHRRPVAAAKLMCQRSQSDEEHRAITVCEGGEFRLWNIFVKERSADPCLVPTLQIFEMNQPENPVNAMRFLALPNDALLSTSYYSDLIACSTKLLHFLPEKNAKEFLPPTACVFNEAAASIATAVGKGIMKYDICTGHFLGSFSDISQHDLTSFALDGERGRRMFVGCSNGELLLINFMTGVVLSRTQAHTREVTSISAYMGGSRHNIYTGSLDGRLRMLEEDSGNLHVHNTVEAAFGDGVGIQYVKIVDLLAVVVAVSVDKKWGIWNSRTFKRIALFEEKKVIAACQVLGTTLDSVSIDEEVVKAPTDGSGAVKREIKHKFTKKEKLLTLALSFAGPNPGIYIYTLDIIGVVGVASYFLRPEYPVMITQLQLLKFSDGATMNYTATKGPSALNMGTLMVGTSDHGHIVTWEVNAVRKTSEALFHQKFDGIVRRKERNVTPVLPDENGTQVGQGGGDVSSQVSIADSISVVTEGAQVPKATNPMVDLQSPLSPVDDETAAMHAAREDPLMSPDLINREANSGPYRPVRQTSVCDHELIQKIASVDTLDQPPGEADEEEEEFTGIDNELEQKLDDLLQEDEDRHHSEVKLHEEIEAKLAREASLHAQAAAMSAPGSHVGSMSHLFAHSAHLSVLHGDENAARPSSDSGGGSGGASANNNNNNTIAAEPVVISALSSHTNHGHNHNRPALSASASAAAMMDHNNSTYILSSELFGIPAAASTKKSIRCWRGHGDDIPVLVPLREHGCVITVSLDGFHRVWNLDGVLLGEMPLPNITEQMKNPQFRFVKKTGWKFIQERIPVSIYHKSLANSIVQDLREKQVPKTSGTTGGPRRGGQTMLSLGGSLGKSFIASMSSAAAGAAAAAASSGSSGIVRSERDEAAELEELERFRQRGSILKSLSEVPTLPDDAPPTEIPQSRLHKHWTTTGRSLAEMEAITHKKDDDDNSSAGSRRLTAFSRQSSVASLTSQSSERGELFQSVSFNDININSNGNSVNGSSKGLGLGDRTRSQSKLVAGGGLEASTVTATGEHSALISPHATTPGSAKSRARLHAAKYANSHAGESLWQLPSELKAASDFAVAPAFSENSLFMSHQAGSIDGEGYRILRGVASHHDKVSVYDRSSEHILLRNPALSLTCKMPALNDVRASEVNFGAQKGMYKNADQLLGERESMPRTQMRHIISLARIEQNVRRVHSMVYVLPPPAHDDVTLPKNATTEQDDPEEVLRTEEAKRKFRLDMSSSMVSPEAEAMRRPLDKKHIERILTKVNEAVESNPEWESKLRENALKKQEQRRKNTKEKISVQARDAIERRLHDAIKSKLKLDRDEAPAETTTAKKPVLTARALLPSYKMSDVKGFLEVFTRTDEDFTGDLNINEWVKLFALFSKSIPAHECKLLFLQIDTKNEGVLTFRDIVPIVFTKADKTQMKLIISYLESEISTKSSTGKQHICVTVAEIDQLFDCYDTDNIGFVAVNYIRERIRGMAMPEPVQFAFMESIIDLEEDEMVNNQEFLRIFRPYCSAKA